MSEQSTEKKKIKKVVRKLEATIEDLAKHANKETYFAIGKCLSIPYSYTSPGGTKQPGIAATDKRIRKLFKISGIDKSENLLPDNSGGKILTFRSIVDMTYKSNFYANLKDKTYICFDYTDITTIFIDTDNLRDVYLSIKDKSHSEDNNVHGDFFYLEKIS